MPIDLYSLSVKKIIIHEIPRHLMSEEKTKPLLSEIESPLDEDLIAFFRNKIIDTIGSSNSFEVIFDPETTSPIPEMVRGFVNSTRSDVVPVSQNMAGHLFSCQTGVNPGGLLTVVECDYLDRRALAVLKVEKEEGVAIPQ